VDRGADVVEVDDELAELILGVLDAACNLRALRDQACEDMGLGPSVLLIGGGTKRRELS